MSREATRAWEQKDQSPVPAAGDGCVTKVSPVQRIPLMIVEPEGQGESHCRAIVPSLHF